MGLPPVVGAEARRGRVERRASVFPPAEVGLVELPLVVAELLVVRRPEMGIFGGMIMVGYKFDSNLYMACLFGG